MVSIPIFVKQRDLRKLECYADSNEEINAVCQRCIEVIISRAIVEKIFGVSNFGMFIKHHSFVPIFPLFL